MYVFEARRCASVLCTGHSSLYALPSGVSFPSSSNMRAHFPTVPVSRMGPNQAYLSTHSSSSRYFAVVFAKSSTCACGKGFFVSQFVLANLPNDEVQ